MGRGIDSDPPADDRTCPTPRFHGHSSVHSGPSATQLSSGPSLRRR
jgi:hypothetical protein